MHTTPSAFGLRHLWPAAWLLWPMWALAAPALDVNMATEADLDSLRGFGPATTARVLAERQKGHFTSWADLMARVRGLRAATATKLSAQGMTVNGQAYPAASGATPPANAPQ